MNKYFIICFLCVLSVSCQTGKREKLESRNETESLVEDPVGAVSDDGEKENDIIDRLLEQGYWVDIPVTYTYHFTGAINNSYKFDMYLIVDSTTVSGQYNYLGNENTIPIEGILLGDSLKIKESHGHIFNGKFDYDAGRIIGTWTSEDGKRVYPFDMANPFGIGYPKRTYKVHLEREEYHRCVRAIQVNYSNGKTIIVTLPDDVEALSFAYRLSVQDYNFDGHLDISLVWMLPAYPPLRYKYLLYDPELAGYHETDIYEDLYTLVDFVNFRNKTVGVYVKGRHYSNTIYKYQDNRFYTIYSEHLTGDPGLGEDADIKTTYFKIEDGTTVSIDKEEYESMYRE